MKYIDESEPQQPRGTVIYHNSNCCPQPRQRLLARSLPGRRVNKRHPPVDPFPPKPPIPRRVVQAGDVIKYFTGWLEDGEELWLRATIQPMTKKLQIKYPDYYNVLNERGEEKSVELLRGGDWSVLRDGKFTNNETLF